MNIETFTVNALQKHQMWYALFENYNDELTLCRPTGAGYEPYNGASAYRMFNGRIVIGFNNAIEAQSQNGLVVIGDGTTEYVSTQPYERIKHICEIAPPNDTQGTFTFVDSQPVLHEGLDWRCDAGRYGPFPYPDYTGEYVNPVSTKSVLLEYEPIISVPGIAHLIYLRRSNFQEERNQFLNNALTQMATATLPEMLVLLNEWAQVSEPPFDNTEEIAKDAKEFLSAIKFNPLVVDGYPVMQLAKFIIGESDARQRPSNPLPPSETILSFVKSRSAHLCLADLLSIDRGLWDVQDIAELEEPCLHANISTVFKQFFGNEAPEEMTIESFIDHISMVMPEERQDYVKSWVYSYKVAEERRRVLAEG